MRHLKRILAAVLVALLLYVIAVVAMVLSTPTPAIGLGAVVAIALAWIPLIVAAVTFVVTYVVLARRKQPRNV